MCITCPFWSSMRDVHGSNKMIHTYVDVGRWKHIRSVLIDQATMGASATLPYSVSSLCVKEILIFCPESCVPRI